MYKLRSKETVNITVPNTRNVRKDVILRIKTDGFTIKGNLNDNVYNVIFLGCYYYTENGEDIVLDTFSSMPRTVAQLTPLQSGMPTLTSTTDVFENIKQRVPQFTDAIIDLEGVEENYGLSLIDLEIDD